MQFFRDLLLSYQCRHSFLHIPRLPAQFNHFLYRVLHHTPGTPATISRSALAIFLRSS